MRATLWDLQASHLVTFYFALFVSGELTERINVVVHCTPIRVKNNTQLTNFMKQLRIEYYSGE